MSSEIDDANASVLVEERQYPAVAACTEIHHSVTRCSSQIEAAESLRFSSPKRGGTFGSCTGSALPRGQPIERERINQGRRWKSHTLSELYISHGTHHDGISYRPLGVRTQWRRTGLPCYEAAMITATMAHTLDPSRHQILVNLGNRYVVFGPSRGPSQAIQFNPETYSKVLPRVADESEAARSRIAQTLRISGLKSAIAAETTGADLELTDDDGNSVLVDLIIRERDPRQRDIINSTERLNDAERRGENLQIWYVNIGRLKLWIMHLQQSRLQIDELEPLDVWEKTQDGICNRSSIVAEVEDWERSISSLYDNVEAWLHELSGLRCERTRSVVMSEEPMQKFAVADRELPLLDILSADEVVASFIPRGLWMIGSWGRLVITTPDRTVMLSAIRHADKQVEWRLFYPDKRRLPGEPFNKENLLALLGLA